jgi:predicted esterase
MGKRAAALGVLVFFVGGAACKSPGMTTTKPNTLTHSETWCPEGFEVGPGDTCFAVPEPHNKDTPILVYLHGMYTGHGSAEEWELVKGATKRGFAVVIPRGKRGMCAWKAELKDYFCWPQEAEDPQAFKSIIGEWDKVLWQVDAILEGGTHKRYVLGFSNGGFFASFVATHGLFGGQAYAIVNGGQLAPPPKPAKPAPLLLVSATEDADQGPKMKELHEGLSKVGWSHAYCTRSGPHRLAADDVDAALRFFEHEAHGGLKAQSGMLPCEGATKPAVPMPEGASAPTPAHPPAHPPAKGADTSKKSNP